MSAETKKRESIVNSVVAEEAPEYHAAITVGKVEALNEEDRSHDIQVSRHDKSYFLASSTCLVFAYGRCLC